MTTYYVDGATGSDNNSGSTTGTPLSGTAATRATATYTLDGSPDLSGVVDNQDTIRIVGETSGRGSTGDIFLITAHDDVADTVTVSPTPTGGTSGLSWYLGGQWATIQRAADSVEPGDTVYVKSSVTYTEEVALTTAGGGPGSGEIIWFEGYDTTPGDGALGSVQWAAGTNYCLTETTLTSAYCHFQYFTFKDASSHLVSCSAQFLSFFHCVFKDGASRGMYSIANHNKVYKCVFDNLGNQAIFFAGSFNHAIANRAVNCSGGVSSTGLSNHVYRNLIECSFVGVSITGDRLYCIANTIHAGTTAIDTTNDDAYAIMDNIIYEPVTGISGNGVDIYHFTVNNLIYNPSTAAYGGTTYDTANNVWTGTDDVYADPKFVDATNDDYTLDATSPAIDAGLVPPDWP